MQLYSRAVERKAALLETCIALRHGSKRLLHVPVAALRFTALLRACIALRHGSKHLLPVPLSGWSSCLCMGLIYDYGTCASIPAPEGPMMAMASLGMKVPLQGCSTTLWDTRSPEPPALACSTL